MLLFSEFVEPLSLDEAYLDVTDNRFGASATAIAREIKRRIRLTTGLTASAGVSVNKFLAKVASDYDKPDGLFVIPPRDVEAFVEKLEIGRFWGVGPVTAERMKRLGIHTGADLKRFSERDLVRRFGKAGATYYRNARGIDDRPVEPNRERKSIGAETTFQEDIAERDTLARRLSEIAGEVWSRVEKRASPGRTVTLKVKYADFEQITRRTTAQAPLRERREFFGTVARLLAALDTGGKPVRLLGVTMSGFDREEMYRQRELDFGDFTE
jgi:DNA polymerase-4